MKNPTATEKLNAHYELLAQSQEKIREIAIRRMPRSEEELIGMIPQKYLNLGVATHVWKDVTKNRPKPDYSLTPLEKAQIDFKHFGTHNNPRFFTHLNPLPNF